MRTPRPVVVEGALVLPALPRPDGTRGAMGGVYDADGRFVRASGIITERWRTLGPVEGAVPAQGVDEELGGRSLYLGYCVPHFGHFLAETLTRLASFDAKQLAAFDHILVLADPWAPFMREAFELLGLLDRLHEVRRPIRVRHMVVAPPLAVYSTTVRGEVRRLAELLSPPPPPSDPRPEPLFLSRARIIPGINRFVVGEAELEAVLHKEGFRVFHPEHSSLRAQTEILRAHSTLVGYMGSAFHTLLLVPGRKHILSYSARHLPRFFRQIDRALDNRARYIAARWPLPAEEHRWKVSFGPEAIDPNVVLRALASEGLISETVHIDIDPLDMTRRYRTALLLRYLVETAQLGRPPVNPVYVQRFREQHELDEDMVRLTLLHAGYLQALFDGPDRGAPEVSAPL